MPPYFRSVSGRLTLATFGLAALSVGLNGILGDPGLQLKVIIVAPMACIALAVFAVGLALDEFPLAASYLVIGLPFIGGLFLVALYLIRSAGPLGYPFAILGVVLLAAGVVLKGGEGQTKSA